MPVSGPVYMGGAHAFPSSGAIHNYIAVVTKVNANLVKSRDDTAWQGSVGTWTKRPFPMGALDMHVILYNKDRQSLIVRTSVNPFPSGRGYFRITQVDFEPGEGPENQAEVKRQKAQRRQDYRERIPIEGKFCQGKNGYQLNCIRAKRADTSVSWLNAIFFVMNLLILMAVFICCLKKQLAVLCRCCKESFTSLFWMSYRCCNPK